MALPRSSREGARCSGGEQGDRNKWGLCTELSRHACSKQQAPLPAGAEDRRGNPALLRSHTQQGPLSGSGPPQVGFPPNSTLGSVSESSLGGEEVVSSENR